MTSQHDTGTSILLESGTNELEVVEFYINNIRYGVNVAKVEEVRYLPEYRSIPQTSKKFMGFFNLRGKVIPIIDLPEMLGAPPVTIQNPQIIVMHFHERVLGFLVERVIKIIRLSWGNIIPPPCSFEHHPVVGVVVEPGREEDLIQLIDFEKIMEEIAPVFKSIEGKQPGVETSEEEAPDEDAPRAFDRSIYKIWLAEDSKMIQQVVATGLKEAGYTQQQWFSNGASAWEAICQVQEENLSQEISLLVSDIEMPQMDGLSLVKNLKDDPIYKGIPAIMFSSLINQNTVHKCQSVGADTQVAKPDMETLVVCMDELIQQYAAA